VAVYAHEDFAGIALYVRGPVQLYDLETEERPWTTPTASGS